MRQFKTNEPIPIKKGATYNYDNKTNVVMLSKTPCPMGTLDVRRLDSNEEQNIFYFELTAATEDAWDNPNCLYDSEVGVL